MQQHIYQFNVPFHAKREMGTKDQILMQGLVQEKGKTGEPDDGNPD